MTLPSYWFLSGFSAKMIHAFLIPMLTACPANLLFLEFVIVIDRTMLLDDYNEM
jgi:hypothetical protein